MKEIEQMRIEQRRDDILQNDHEAHSGDEAAAAEQREMRDPHGDQQRRPNGAELDRDAEHLIVRIVGTDRGSAGGAGRAAELLGDRARPVAEYRRRSSTFKA